MIGIRKIITASSPLIVAMAFTFICMPTLKAQSITAKVVLDSSKMVIGDQITMHVTVDQPKDAKVVFPSYKDTIAGKLEIVKILKRDTTLIGKNIRVHQAYLITCFDSGSYHINSLALAYQLGNIKDTLRLASLDLNVNTLPVDTTKEIRDIRSPYKIKFSLIDIWIPLVIVLGSFFIIFIVWYLIKFRKKGNFFFPAKPFVPSYVLALEELDSLRNEKLWQNNKIKLYYTRLTEIIRNYIQNRYGINALEMTSDEILVALKDLRLDDNQPIELLQNMFSISDMVKFAKAEPLPEANEIGLLNAYQFVNNTKPVETIKLEDKSQTQINNQ